MKTTTSTNFRDEMTKYMRQVNQDSEPIEINPRDGNSIVVLSRDDYDNMIENLYLFSNKVNRDHISESIQQLNDGNVTEIGLDDL